MKIQEEGGVNKDKRLKRFAKAQTRYAGRWLKQKKKHKTQKNQNDKKRRMAGQT